MLYLNKNRNITYNEWDNVLTTLDMADLAQRAKTIVIKPNFAAGTYADPATHVMSDMDLLRNCIEFLCDFNEKAIIYIAESDSTGYGFAYLKFEHLRLPESLRLSEKCNRRVKLLDLSRDRLLHVESVSFRRYTSIDRQLWLSETLMSADLIVNLSNLKTHAVTGYTGACKNLFGCLPDTEKYHNHPYIHQVIHDLVIAIKPQLNVVDAFYGMERNGPVQGIDINSGYRVFSDNPIEADIYAAKTIGYQPQKIRYVKYLCEDCNVDIDPEDSVIKKYRKPQGFLRVMNAAGLFIQRIGLALECFGHRIHSCPTPMVLLITIVRPILLKIFDYEKLKAWKRKIIK